MVTTYPPLQIVLRVPRQHRDHASDAEPSGQWLQRTVGGSWCVDHPANPLPHHPRQPRLGRLGVRCSGRRRRSVPRGAELGRCELDAHRRHRRHHLLRDGRAAGPPAVFLMPLSLRSSSHRRCSGPASAAVASASAAGASGSACASRAGTTCGSRRRSVPSAALFPAAMKTPGLFARRRSDRLGARAAPSTGHGVPLSRTSLGEDCVALAHGSPHADRQHAAATGATAKLLRVRLFNIGFASSDPST